MTIHDEMETLRKIQEGYSISRFGDGEFRLINGKNMIFQDYDNRIVRLLKKILSQDNIPKKLLIGIPPFYKNKNTFYCPERITNKKVETYWRRYMNKKESKNIEDIINYDKIYYSSFISRIESFEYCKKKYLEELSKIWNKRNVVLIMNQKKYSEVSNIIKKHLDTANILEIIFCKERNAFEYFDCLLDKCKKFNKSTLFLIMAGPTAAVLSYKLCKSGYQSVDIGSFFEMYGQ
ncbi:protein of unknown function DUF1792 [Catovirus CTV1]|uniref:Glycosyltransferase GT-D fold domain-containing protein n=1 Tax=Catovirus CTV1 TaxID=1977631 RepID=A0A1V0SAI7_9VIRU|nr:protein of unknown function DUF1792 [Catovirus CTV1]